LVQPMVCVGYPHRKRRLGILAHVASLGTYCEAGP
jgi:hypothetical protein